MPNNLNKMIIASGKSKREVAEAKGITPETLSRHISGKIGMSLNDAEDYAEILNCAPQDVFFGSHPAPIIGKNTLHPGDYQGKPITEAKWVREMGNFGKYFTQYQSVQPGQIGFFMTKVAPEYNGRFHFFDNVIDMVLLEPIEKQYVSNQQCAGRLCYIHLDEDWQCDAELSKVWQVLVYPNPDGTHTLVNPFGLGTAVNKRLLWATPVLGVNLLPTQTPEEVLNSSRGRMQYMITD